MTRILSGPEALKLARQSRDYRRFPSKSDPRLADKILFPVLQPSFSLEPGRSVFTIGSCFARNIEEKLADFDLPTRNIWLPAEDVGGRGNSILNEFNPGSISQRLGWAVAGRNTAEMDVGFAGTGADVYDVLLVKGNPRPKERLVEIRRLIDKVYQAVPTSDAMIVTLGMAEAWYDSETDLWLNRMPEARDILAAQDRYQLRIVGPADAVAMMAGAIEALVDAGLRKILVTVSPVPLQSTFSGRDCVIGNSYSKSVMRITAAELADRFPGIVDYYPSYEMVLTGGDESFRDDLIHARPEVIARVTQYMIENYVRA